MDKRGPVELTIVERAQLEVLQRRAKPKQVWCAIKQHGVDARFRSTMKSALRVAKRLGPGARIWQVEEDKR